MPLKRQLLLISLLFITLPWAGCQFIREVESALRQGQEQSLQASSTAIANVLQADHTVLELLRRDQRQDDAAGNAILFEPAPIPIVVDGYADEDWDSMSRKKISAPGFPDQYLNYRAATRDGRVYLFIEVFDQDINYLNPAKADASDQLILLLGDVAAGELRSFAQRYAIASSSPGRVNVVRVSDDPSLARAEPSINAYWQDTIGGFHLELSIPLSLTQGRIGFYRKDTNRDVGLLHYGTVVESAELAPRAVYSTDSLSSKLKLLAIDGQKIGLLDRDGLVVAEHGSFIGKRSDDSNWLLRRIYSRILELPVQQYIAVKDNDAYARPELGNALQGQVARKWYLGQQYSNRSILSSANPLTNEGNVIGAVFVEQSSEQFLALTDSAFSKILLISFAALIFTITGLLGYASWLSLRIRRLSQAAERAIADDGSVRTEDFPKSRAADEIGDLSRSYGGLLGKVREYTEYLQSLSRKLSHELRTPLAVVHSSLDNLEREQLDKQATVYLQRAKDGATQLSHILSAMSEATRVEESIASADKERCDLLTLLTDISRAYSDIYPRHTVQFNNLTGQDSFPMQLAPELIAQMLDKLMENAVDYAPSGSTIDISCARTQDQTAITVSNEGEALSDSMRNQLFQKMVSMRSGSDQGMHLGLGLHIVRLIAEFHHGEVKAYNLANNIGVCFEVCLPNKH
ncbi:MAG: ATP-binding protein [Pseudomonadota bacterium]